MRLHCAQVDILIALLSTDAAVMDKSTHEGNEAFFAETGALARLQCAKFSRDTAALAPRPPREAPAPISVVSRVYLRCALASFGTVDVVIQLLSAARDVGKRSAHQKALVPKVIELGAALVDYGDPAVQDRFVDHIERERRGLGVARHFLGALRSQLRAYSVGIKGSFERQPFKGAKQEEKRIALLQVEFLSARQLLAFLQMLCEGHNDRAQRYMRVQSATRNVDVVSEVVLFMREILDALPSAVAYVRDADAVCAFLEASSALGPLGGALASPTGLRLIAWYQCAPSDLRVLSLQCSLLAASFDVLAEFTQGPCAENQLALARSRAAETVSGVLDFLLSLQLSGAYHGKTWVGGSGREIAELLCEAMAPGSGERDEVAKWLTKFSRADFADEWAAAQAELVACARRMERSLLVMLGAMLEGDTPAEVYEHLATCLPAQTLVALLALHWSRYDADCRRRRRRYELSTRISAAEVREEEEAAAADAKEAAARRGVAPAARAPSASEMSAELAFLYYSLAKLLTDENVAAAAAVPLRAAVGRWEASAGSGAKWKVRRIEIVDASGKLGRVYFQLPEHIDQVWKTNHVEQVKRRLLGEAVQRDDAQEKLKAFWEGTDELVAVAKHTHDILGWQHAPGVLGKLGQIGALVAQSYAELNYLSIVLAVFVSLTMLYPAEWGEPEESSEWLRSSPLVGVAGAKQGVLRIGLCCLLASTSLELASHALAHVMLKVRLGLSALRRDGGVIASFYFSSSATRSTTRDSPVAAKLFAYLRGEDVFIHRGAAFHALFLIFVDLETLKYLLFFSTALLSVAHTPAWSCVNLLALVERMPSMLYVVVVLRRNGDQMLASLLFAFMVIYIFSVFSFTVPYIRDQYTIIDHFPRYMDFDDEQIAIAGTTNLFLYTLFHWDYGFREGPMFAHSFAQASVPSTPHHHTRM